MTASAPHVEDGTTRGSILVVDALMPDPTRDSGSLRMMHLLALLREQGWRVYFMPDNRRTTATELARLTELGVHVLCRPWASPLAGWLQAHGAELDAVILSRHYVAAAHLDLVRRHASRARVIFDTVDLHYLRERRTAEHERSGRMRRQAEDSRRQELALIARSDVTLVVSPTERDLLAADAPGARVELLSNIHAVHGRGPGFEARRDILFVGGFAHPPNRDAAFWLADAILPRLHKRRPGIILHLVGDIPEADRVRLARPGIRVHGRVESLEPLLHGCRVAVAPLRFGAGVKGKVNTAMSYGVPVVATAIAAEGMQLEHGLDVLVADNPQDFADAVVRAHDDPALWATLSEGGLRNVSEHFSFDAARRVLQAILPASDGRA